MPEPICTAYDTVVYPGYAYVQTHPDRIATLARLCGIEPAPIETCRVLEVGCGDAQNVIPMALGLPGASFRGFDLAASAIERGQALTDELGIANLTLEQLDICQAPVRFGEFDYIIAHGFYSWVPEAAREKLMALCRASLSPRGVAFISYNTFPGGHIRRMVREMMLFHVERAPDPQTKIKQSRALLDFLSNLATGDEPGKMVLKEEFKRVGKYPAGYLYHDDLAPINDPVYLHEFVSHAAAHGLQFVGDLNSSFGYLGDLDAETAQSLAQLENDLVLREQYLDFARCRRFRQTLLCHANLAVDHRVDARRIEGLLVSSPAAPISGEFDPNSDGEAEFRGPRSALLKTDHPVMKAAMSALHSAWPERLSLEALCATVAARLGGPLDSIPPSLLCEGLMAGFRMRVLDFHLYSPRVTRLAGDRPQTNPLIRLQASNGTMLTSILHETVRVEEPGLRLLSLLDGQRTRAQLQAELPATSAELNSILEQLARLALLEA